MLTVQRAPRADALAAALAEMLASPASDPFAPEVVSVPTRGVERWLSQTLAATLGASPGAADGICANVRFPFPAGIVNEALALATGVDPATDPWLPGRLVWPLIEATERAAGEAWLTTLAGHIGAGDPDDSHRRDRRFGALRHVADLFDRYAVHRPEMLLAWGAGDDSDGDGGQIDDDLAWQPRLWRLLRELLAVPSLADRLEPACVAIRARPEMLDLPQRLSLFGLTRLPVAHLRVLHAIAEARDVHLFLLHPSDDLWRRVRPHADRRTPPRRRDDPTVALPRNPLLASWGRDVREVQLTIGARAGADRVHLAPAPPETLLGRLQAGVRGDTAPPGAPAGGAPDERLVMAGDDDSVQVHSCHGRGRQVEVVRDAVLRLMAADHTLEPRDVLVMCPDVEEFAPLVHATFAAGDDDDQDVPRPPDLRVRLADRSIRQTNPVLGAVAALLDLVEARFTASQVLDLAGHAPVRMRFGFGDDELSRIERWARDAGVRWGLDAESRVSFALGDLEANTWRAGVDRLLVGVAVAEGDLMTVVDGVLPLDDVASASIDLAGRLAEFLSRLTAAVAALRGPHTVAGWTGALRDAADLLTAVPDADAWQRVELERVMDEVIEDTYAGSSVVLSLAEIRALLADRLRGRPTRANFRTGHLTVCTLVPMRSVPHRVICVMGLDDGAFPRRGRGDGDDVLDRDPRVGDRDTRGEDRQLLLDALLAAGEHLVLVHTGRDERTNAELPPSVPVLELLDVIDRTAIGAGGDPARDQVVVRHPLQPFDPRNFTPDALGPRGVWGFDPAACDGARALVGPRTPVPAFLDGPLPPLADGVIELTHLVDALRTPVRSFLRRRLGVWAGVAEAAPTDAFTIDADALTRWGVGDRILRARCAGVDAARCREAELLRGQLPPGALAEAALAEVLSVVESLLAARPPDAISRPAESVPVEVTLHDGRLLIGTVPGVHGDCVVDLGYSRVKPARRLAAWARLLALTAAEPERPWSAGVVGKRGPGAACLTLAPLPGRGEARRQAALVALAILVDVHDRAMREPLPLAEGTSFALVDPGQRRPMEAARKAWEGEHRVPGENAEPAHVLAFGRRLSFDELRAVAPAADEAGPGWGAGGRAERLARRLWQPLLEHLAATA